MHSKYGQQDSETDVVALAAEQQSLDMAWKRNTDGACIWLLVIMPYSQWPRKEWCFQTDRRNV